MANLTTTPQEIWNSLEIAKLLVGALTPIIIIIIGIWIAKITKRLEQKEWASRRVIERRVDVYDEISPSLNDLLTYFTFVGQWKELTPPELIEKKRLTDRNVYVSSAFFSKKFISAYFSFMHACFETYIGWGYDARLRCDPHRHKEAAKENWNNSWDVLFSPEEKRTTPKKVKDKYISLMKILTDELQLGLDSSRLTPGRTPENNTQQDKTADSQTCH